MISLLKAACLVIYAIALAGFAGWSSGALAATMQIVAATLIGVHVLEVVCLFKHVRRYRGALAASVLLTMLFGLLHLWPLSTQTPSIAN